MKKKILYIFLILILNFHNLASADEKENIINKLENTKSLKFKFEQKTNEEVEEGVCQLVFPSKLKCSYNDNKQKELIINKNRLAITQKRYNKTSYYSLKKSPFLNILNKNQLIELVKKSSLMYKNNIIRLTSLNGNQRKTVILFDKNNFNLIGWEIEDQFQNKIIFLIEILSINKEVNLKIFEIPA